MREGGPWIRFAAASGLMTGLTGESHLAQAQTIPDTGKITAEFKTNPPPDALLRSLPAPEKKSPPILPPLIPDKPALPVATIPNPEVLPRVRAGYNLYPLTCLPLVGFRTMGGSFNDGSDSYTFQRLLAQQGVKCTGGPLELSTVFQYGNTTFNYTSADETAAQLSFREKTLLLRAGIHLPHLRLQAGHEFHFTLFANSEQPVGSIFPNIDSALYQATDLTTYIQTPGQTGPKFQEKLNFDIKKYGLVTKLQFPGRRHHRFELELELLYQSMYLNLQTTILDTQTATNLNLLKVDTGRLSLTKKVEALEIGLGASYTYKQLQFLCYLGLFGDASNRSYLYDGHCQIAWHVPVIKKVAAHTAQQ